MTVWRINYDYDREQYETRRERWQREDFETTGKLPIEWHDAVAKEYRRQHINYVYGDLFPAQVHAGGAHG